VEGILLLPIFRIFEVLAWRQWRATDSVGSNTCNANQQSNASTADTIRGADSEGLHTLVLLLHHSGRRINSIADLRVEEDAVALRLRRALGAGRACALHRGHSKPAKKTQIGRRTQAWISP
jgi:hypothetical protein